MFKPVALTLVLGLSSLSSISNAAPVPGEFDIAVKCPELSLVPAQKEQLKTLIDQTKMKLKAQKAALVESKKVLVASLADVNVTQETVVAQEATVKANVDALLDTMFASVNHATFTILLKEQRPQAVACFQKVKKEWKKKWLDKKCATRTTPTEESDDVETELGL